jgi:mannose-6-phosphate isomerase-like protein (cupin superfamily)
MQTVKKMWGEEIIWALTPQYCGKILNIWKGKRLSLQYHKEKRESFYVLSGRLTVQWKAGKQIFYPGDCAEIPPGTIHRFEADTDVTLLEVSTPELSDVVRIEDDYGRAGKKAKQ